MYDRALSDVERETVEAYLQYKYKCNVPPGRFAKLGG